MGEMDREQDATLYRELRRLAAYYMKMERNGHTLQPTALVNEAILRVYDGVMPSSISQKQIIATLARAMRRVLVDYARKRGAAKRSMPELPPEADSPADESYRAAEDVLTVDLALAELLAVSERAVRIVELRYFAGMTEDETAQVLSISRETVARDWRFARAWLKLRLKGGAQAADPN
jgi:RNA polymerase sigma factor (TIGR02999 family)